MVDKILREPKEQLLTPLIQGPLRGIHPTAVTLLAAAIGLFAAIAAWQGAYGLAIGFWIINRILDGLDGTLARLTNQQSDLGAYLDIVLDHLIYAIIPLGLTLADGRTEAYIALGLLLTSFYINGASWMYLSSILEKRRAGATVHGELTGVTMPTGLIEGAETIVFYSLFLLFPAAIIPLFGLMAALVVVTIGQRLVWAVGNIEQ